MDKNAGNLRSSLPTTPHPGKVAQITSTIERVAVWPSFLALLVIGGLFYFLSDRLTVGPSWVMPVIIGVLLLILVVAWILERHIINIYLGRFTTALVTLSEAIGVILLVLSLPDHSIPGADLLRDAGILWFTNIIIFGLWYWELDGNGPGVRHREGYKATDFLFPQILAGPEFSQGWKPGFLDYLYLAFNTSTAFSPADTAVLSRRAKLLMMVQSCLSLVVVAMLAARAINILPTGG